MEMGGEPPGATIETAREPNGSHHRNRKRTPPEQTYKQEENPWEATIETGELWGPQTPCTTEVVSAPTGAWISVVPFSAGS